MFEGESFGRWLHRALGVLTTLAVNAGTQTMFLFMEIMSSLTEDYFPGAKFSIEQVNAISLTDIRLTFLTHRGNSTFDA